MSLTSPHDEAPPMKNVSHTFLSVQGGGFGAQGHVTLLPTAQSHQPTTREQESSLEPWASTPPSRTRSGFTVTRVVPHDGEGPLKAFCDIAVSDLLVIRGVRVVAGRQGPFVSMPRQQARNGQWHDSIVPLTSATKAEIQRVVLHAFHRTCAAQPTREVGYGEA